jgi:hypothetical protein
LRFGHLGAPRLPVCAGKPFPSKHEPAMHAGKVRPLS